MKKENPTIKYPMPPFSKQRDIEVPGKEKEMYPRADHGEKTYKGSGRLQDKVAIITGADSGIGRAIAIAYAREGADVAICYGYAGEEEDARETAKWVKAAGRKGILIESDIRSEDNCKDIVDTTIKEFGKIDILINNAAYQMSHETLQEITEGQLRRTFETNVFGMFYLCKAAEKYLKPGSSIINTASVNSYNPNSVLLDYAATKGAIQNFTANLAQMMLEQGKGIRVNAVAPGPVWTPLIPSTMPDPKNFGKETPMKRPAQPVELSPSYVFLASDESSYISGATIAVTGGKVAF
jgi:NAD(P)-dependent dehydrogenase (short-subunit alcohol dehydrogenase family)